MTYCASYPRYASHFERRPLFTDILSPARFALVSVAFAGAVGACLIYGRPGGTIELGTAPQIALAPRVAPVPKSPERHRVTPKISVSLTDLMFPLDFLPAPLAKSAPRAAAFERLGSAMQVAKIEAEQVVPAPVPSATNIADRVPLPARRAFELSRPRVATREIAQAIARRSAVAGVAQL